MVLDYWLGECIGIRVKTARYWRALVANILAASVPVFADFEDGTTEQPCERLPIVRLIHRLPCESRIEAVKPVAVASVKPIREPLALRLPPLPSQLGENETTRFVLVTERRQTPCYIGTPRRILGHNGSARLGKPNWGELAEAVGAEAVASVVSLPVADWRKLELLASVILSGKAVVAVRRTEAAEKANREGFSEVSESTLTHRQSRAENADNVLLAIVTREESRLIEAEKAASVAAALLDSVAAGLSVALKAGLSVTEAAKLCGVSASTAYRRIGEIRAALTKSVG